MKQSTSPKSKSVSSSSKAAQIFCIDPLQRVTLGYLINLLARLLAQSLRARNGEDGILPGQFPIVLELLNNKGPTQRELCDYIKVEQSTMANTLKRMERDGLVERRLYPKDARQSCIYLTERGTELARIAVANALKINRIALSGLDNSAQESLRSFLIDMTTRLETDLTRYD
jgi:DNA-binding MarR family transcriptional regulator